MGRPCSVCCSPDRRAIEKAMVESTAPLREIAERYGMSAPSLVRHRKNCLRMETRPVVKPVASKLIAIPPPKEPEEKPPKEPETEPIILDVYSRLQQLVADSEAILERAKDECNDKLALEAMDACRKNLDTAIRGFEAQKRAETLYAPKEHFSASTIYRFLRERHPKVLSELTAYLKEAR
jgi:hypothetical protein